MPTDPRGLIDVHAHFVTDDYVAAATAAGHAFPDGMPGWPSWDAATHLALMDQWGIATSVLSVSSPGVHFGDDTAARVLARQVNEFGVGVARAVVFVHPTSPACFEAVSLGRPRPMLEFIFDTTRTVSDLVFSGVLTRHPDIEWVFTHERLLLDPGGRHDRPGRLHRRCRPAPRGNVGGSHHPQCPPPPAPPPGAAGLTGPMSQVGGVTARGGPWTRSSSRGGRSAADAPAHAQKMT